jgi:hypothetical protein
VRFLNGDEYRETPERVRLARSLIADLLDATCSVDIDGQLHAATCHRDGGLLRNL